MNRDALLEFVTPYYQAKDIMHNLWHIELVVKTVDKIIAMGNYPVDRDKLLLATYFHGFIYSKEQEIRRWLSTQNYTQKAIDFILQIAWESQRSEVPISLEGKILHDAHVLEGGRTYLVVKTLITGSVRGQSLPETLEYMKKHVLNKNACYLPETIPLCVEMNHYTNTFYNQIITDLI